MKIIFARITTDTTAQEFLSLLKNESQYIKAIVSQETSEKDKEHLHCLIQVNSDDVMKNIYQNFRNYLKRIFPSTYSNKSYAISKTLEGTEARIAAYCLKDGNFCYYGFTEEEIKKFKKLSYKKQKATDFSTKRQILEDSFIVDEISSTRFIRDYIKLLSDFRMRNTEAQIYNYLAWCHRIKDPAHREHFADQMIERFNREGW